MVANEKGGSGREGLGVWDVQMQTITYRVDKQRGPTGNHNGKEYEKDCIYMYN